jgi:hypothetical protein
MHRQTILDSFRKLSFDIKINIKAQKGPFQALLANEGLMAIIKWSHSKKIKQIFSRAILK